MSTATAPFSAARATTAPR
uniref:Uncharacterized protein n=1 Tax=Arundo donax TaxID=35708 RepID=A0A0A9FFI5_ARUDO